MKRILLAGATGYLGSYILKELEKRNLQTTIIVRGGNKPINVNPANTKIIQAEVTDPKTIINSCKDIYTVISTIGITKQKDGLKYWDVDFQANMNLLNEAIKSGVRKFIYVSVLNGEALRELKICNAKESFVDELKTSGLNYCIIRPNGFFSDMTEYYNMAKKGRVYILGDGRLKANPIHGADLAEICVDAIESKEKEINAGGPEIMTHNDIAKIAFEAVGLKVKITYIPDWIRRFTQLVLKTVTRSVVYGPIEFFLTVISMDMIAPKYGKHTLKEYFEKLNKQA